MKRIMAYLSYLWALNKANLGVHRADWKKLLLMSLSMMIQNSMFLALWFILFLKVSNLKGWVLTDVARMFGIFASCCGLSLFFFNGARTIAFRIQDGSLDALITKPRSALPAVLMSSSGPASLGDIFYGPLLWLTFGDTTWPVFWELVGLTLLAAIIFTSMNVMIYSLGFWLKYDTRFSDQLFELFLIASGNIQHGQPLAVQLVVYTIIPAAFIGLLPVNIVKSFDPALLALLLGGVLFYATLSVIVFYRGLRRYKNAQV